MDTGLPDDTELEPTTTPAPVTAQTPVRIGSGRYEEGRVLGVGGMGRVVANEDRYLGRVVARKTLLESQSGRARTRFLREVRIQAQLEHPAIVPVYELDVEAEPPSFTMKRVRGVTLSQAIADGGAGGSASRSPRRLLSVFASVCQAVDYAHRRGVVHRDLKPANIMLGDFGEVYVLDWGVARVDADDAPEGSVSLGSTAPLQNQRAGTRGYMAPEVLLGESPGDARSDVFSLGMILFHIVTGVRAFDPSSDAEPGPVDATARAKDLKLSAPPELLAVCDRALAAAQDRFESARALYEAVQSYLDGDRDLALRRDTSDSLTRSALARLEDGAAAEQRLAMRDLAGAIALTPTHEPALRALHRLLAEPPREVPPDVRAALSSLDDRRLVAMATPARWTALLGIPAVIAAVIAMGVRDGQLFALGCALAVVLGLAVAAEGWLAARREPSSRPRARRRDLGPLLLLSAGAAGFSIIAGPFVLVPALATAIAMIRVLRDARQVWLVIACAVLAVAGPYGLEAVGVLPTSYSFEGGAWSIQPWVSGFPRGPTIALGLVTATSVIAGGAGIAARFRRELDEIELRNHLYLWQLSQLLPPSGGSPSAE